MFKYRQLVKHNTSCQADFTYCMDTLFILTTLFLFLNNLTSPKETEGTFRSIDALKKRFNIAIMAAKLSRNNSITTITRKAKCRAE